jgi:2-dehydropantoate 2-reductase
VWNCTWSSVEGLTRATPEFFALLPPELQQQVKLLIREIVSIGFKTGLLETGQPQYPLGGQVGTEEEQCKAAWDVVSPISVRYLVSSLLGR